MPSTNREGGGTSSSTCRQASGRASVAKGSRPVSISNSTTPTEYTSARVSARPSAMSSGAR